MTTSDKSTVSGGIERHGAVASPTATTLLHFLNLALEIVVAGVEIDASLDRLNDMLEVMVAEGRDPSDTEWLILAERSEAAHAAIQAGDDLDMPDPPAGDDKGGKSKR